jgi:zinc transport system substrate-binding protein
MPESHQNRLGFKMKGLVCFVLGIMVLGLPLASGAQEVVVASTSLAGAIAKAAGAREVRVLTPDGVRHPPEYELKPSDLVRFEDAKVVVYGGYERMVSKLLETSRNKSITAIQIDTGTSPENLVAQARKIAGVLKTEREEQSWEERFLENVNGIRKRLSAFSGKRAVVHLQAQPFARWAELVTVGVIRPGELTPKAIADAVSQSPDLVVDILHMPVAKVIAENAKCKYLQVINFPGVENTKTLEDIFEYNATQLMKAFQ